MVHRIRALCALLAALLAPLTLAGCGDTAEDAFARFRAALADADVSATAEVTMVSDDTVTAFTLDCETGAEETVVSVTSPESLAGVRAHLRDGSDALEFDGLVLPLETAGEGALSPLTALPAVVEAARAGYAELVWTEDEYTVAQLVLDDETAVRLYLDAAGAPVYAEVSVADATVVQCTITSWQTNEREAQDESNNSDVGGNQPAESGA